MVSFRFFLTETKINTCTIYLFLIFLNTVSKQEMLTVKCYLNLQFRANIRRIQICFLIFFKTETSGMCVSFCLVVFSAAVL